MEQLTQTISNLVGILLGVVGAIGVGFFIYGAYMYLTASGAPNQMERGKSAMMTALAGIVLALVAYGVVELVMNAVVELVMNAVRGPGNRRGRRAARTHTPVGQLGGREKGETHERTRGTDSRPGRGPGAIGVDFSADRGGDGGVRHLLRRIPLRPHRPLRGAHGPGRRLRTLRRSDGRGKIGGRRLPLVAADLLKYRLGARVYAGPVSQLVRSEPPAPAQPVRSGPGPLSLMAKRAGRGLGRLRKRRKTRKNKERRNGRMRWFGKRRGKDAGNQQARDHRAATLETRRRKPRGFLAFAALAVLAMALVTVPQVALADDHEPWRDEIDFELTEPVEGRRIFVERLTVSGDRAAVTFRAATALDIRVRAYGGPEGTWLRFWGSGTLTEGERIDYSLPLHGPAPSFTVSWEDTLGQAGALTIEHDRIPYPLPAVEGELCDLRMTSLGWTPGAVSGVIESECVSAVEEPIELQTVAGHQSVTETALMDAQVTAITGTVAAATGASHTSVAFVPNGETRFQSRRAHGRGDSRRERGREP